ncbi:MAG: 6,7-dimethyl-8-ribityllumazine synthase [Bacteroidota bacterium]
MSDSHAHDLSGIRYTGNHSHSEDQVAIIVSRWHPTITETLCQGATRVLREAGIPDQQIFRYDVPGSFELPVAASMILQQSPHIDAVITLGCIVQGETRHFEFIAQAVAQGIVQVGVEFKKPVIFGVLTPDTDQQAADRAGGKYGNKGEEAAVAALEMLDLRQA